MDIAEKIKEDYLSQIAKIESEQLNIAFTRFCLRYGKPMLLTNVTERRFEQRPNYREYYYNLNQPDEYFLMYRELEILEDNTPALNIHFNRNLIEERDKIN